MKNYCLGKSSSLIGWAAKVITINTQMWSLHRKIWNIWCSQAVIYGLHTVISSPMWCDFIAHMLWPYGSHAVNDGPKAVIILPTSSCFLVSQATATLYFVNATRRLCTNPQSWHDYQSEDLQLWLYIHQWSQQYHGTYDRLQTDVDSASSESKKNKLCHRMERYCPRASL